MKMVGKMVTITVCMTALISSTAALRGSSASSNRNDEVPAMPSASSFVQVDATATQTSTKQHLGVRGDMTVQGTLKTDILTSPIGNVKVSGNLNVGGVLEAGSVTGAHVKASSMVSVRGGISPKAGELLILGKIDTDTIKADTVESSFLEIDGVKQWSLVSLEDFEEEAGGGGGGGGGVADGWSHQHLSQCAGNQFLGGPCNKAPESLLEKTYSGLPPHSQIRITSKYLFIDSWDGEHAFLKIDGKNAWADTYHHQQSSGEKKGSFNLCGNETPEGRFMSHVDVTVPHTSDSVKLSFGATLDEHSCDESFGIDSIMILVR